MEVSSGQRCQLFPRQNQTRTTWTRNTHTFLQRAKSPAGCCMLRAGATVFGAALRPCGGLQHFPTLALTRGMTSPGQAAGVAQRASARGGFPRPLRVAVEGNIATGKSTFLEIIQEAHPRVTVVQEPIAKWTNVEGDEGDGTQPDATAGAAEVSCPCLWRSPCAALPYRVHPRLIVEA